MLTETPQYKLTAPMIISARLMPAVNIADGTLSAEAHAIEHGGRAHFKFHLDVPMYGTWTSDESYVTTLGRDWTHAVALALETFTDSAAQDDVAENVIAQDMPTVLRDWVVVNASDFMIAAENLRDWLDAN